MLKEEIEELKGSVETMEKEVKEQTLALELLKEVKKSAKRWFIVSIILLIALIGSNIAWLIYESQWTYETTETQTVEQNQEDTNYSNMSGVIN